MVEEHCRLVGMTSGEDRVRPWDLPRDWMWSLEKGCVRKKTGKIDFLVSDAN